MIPEYLVSIKAAPNRNAPSLQSFIHGTSGSEWLLFAGRTNSIDSLNGGLHNLHGNYANTSFTKVSFNENIYVYDPIIDAVPTSISITKLTSIISENFDKENTALFKKFLSVFKNTNANVKQVDEFLYITGGYGAINFEEPTKGYITYDHIARIHVPSMIQLVKGNYEGMEKSKLFAFTRNKSLVSTGGELYYIGGKTIKNGTFYLVGGHNFGKKAVATGGQKYVDAVYPFSIGSKIVKKDTLKHTLSLSFNSAISDVSDPNGAASDNTSIFRRRDGPILPSIYKSPVSNKILPGIAIYAGVFKPGNDSNLQAWNDAIYVHPQWANKESKLFTYDKTYNQKNYNVYASPNFVAYDSISGISHSYLLGGIGDGPEKDYNDELSGFTNTGMHIKTDINKHPLKSENEIFSNNLFSENSKNKPPFYGAEAILFPNENISYSKYSNEIIDLNTTFKNTNSIDVGYIFGGIEAFKPNPGTYGKRNSRASNKVWKVTLTKQTVK
ncbi:hypothetical protein [Polaribacter sp. SA4-12]|uniref:hypothetical protein n=1 Tax=Polaribacter sp. SA4-12 TaxID=1312072 RepID=UPI0012FA04A2|nr:hypothetical protein [Polaribacter sp. SA4-12]